jgi:hypothetical protein
MDASPAQEYTLIARAMSAGMPHFHLPKSPKPRLGSVLVHSSTGGKTNYNPDRPARKARALAKRQRRNRSFSNQ